MPPFTDSLDALILEDEPRYRDFLSEVLRDMGCVPRTESTADGALRRARENPPDLVLLDLNLPVVDGISFLEQFRRICADTPVVIITGFGDLASAKRAIRLGVTDFLGKPCDLGQIERAIDRARRQLERNADARVAPGDTPDSGTDEPISSLYAVERETIMDALRRCQGNRSLAAKCLGIGRRTLYNKIAEYQSEGHSVP